MDKLDLIITLLSVPGIVFVFSLKGFSQAFVAKKLGDDTPERNGQLTLSPLAHIDIIGFLCILLLGIGWGKPVQTNSRNYKNIKRDSAIQILSGPVGLIIGGLFLSFLSALTMFIYNRYFFNTVLLYLATIFFYGMMYCLLLANFYLIPLPGLDGYKLIANFLPYKAYRQLYVIEKYSMFIFLGFILIMNYTGWLDFLFIPSQALQDGFNSIWESIFNVDVESGINVLFYKIAYGV